MKKFILTSFIFLGVLLFGCCAITPESSSGSSTHCKYGTYGSACTAFCEKSKGTEFDSGANCFSECIDIVKKQGLGDSTTCCKENVKEGCKRLCIDTLSKIYAEQGVQLNEEEIGECIGECIAPYEMIGIDTDSFCNILG